VRAAAGHDDVTTPTAGVITHRLSPVQAEPQVPPPSSASKLDKRRNEYNGLSLDALISVNVSSYTISVHTQLISPVNIRKIYI